MPATVTLSTTTLVFPMDGIGGQVCVLSASGIVPGTRLVICDPAAGETVNVIGIGQTTAAGTFLQVQRAVDGSMAGPHVSGSQIYIAAPSQLYSQDPRGTPPSAIAVSPWINVRTGAIWFAQGDVEPVGNAARYWVRQTYSYDNSVLGVNAMTPTPTAST